MLHGIALGSADGHRLGFLYALPGGAPPPSNARLMVSGIQRSVWIAVRVSQDDVPAGDWSLVLWAPFGTLNFCELLDALAEFSEILRAWSTFFPGSSVGAKRFMGSCGEELELDQLIANCIANEKINSMPFSVAQCLAIVF